MNYEIFRQMEEGSCKRREEEREQEYMERIFRTVCENGLEEKKSVNDMLAPEFHSCSREEGMLCLRLTPQDWQTNPNGTLHGGIIATAFDMAFGMLARYYAGSEKTVTMELNVNYMRAVPLEETYLVRVRASKAGRRVKFFRGELILEKSGKLAAEAASLFM